MAATGEDPIKIEIEFDGADQAATASVDLATAIAALAAKIDNLGQKTSGAEQKVKNLRSAEQGAAEATRQLAAEETAAATQAISFGQKLAGVAGAVSGLVNQLGGQGGSIGLAGTIANVSMQFASMGAALGPQGAVVGGIVGALIPAFQTLISETNEAAEANARLNEQLARQAEGLTRLTDRISEQNRAREEMNRLVSGGFRDRGEAQGAITAAEQAAADLPAQIAAIEEEIRILSGVAGNEARIRAARRRIADLRAQEFGAQITAGAGERFVVGDKQRESEQAAAREEMASRERSATAEQAGREGDVDRLSGQLNNLRTPTASEAMSPAVRAAVEEIHRLREVADEAFRAINEHSADFDEQLRTAASAIAEVEIATLSLERTEADLAAQREANHQRRLEQQEFEKQKARERLEEERRDQEARQRLLRESTERLIEANNRAGEAYRAQAESYKETTGVLVGGLTDALASIIAGQKSAEEAFKGLLASFLKFIAEQSVLKAASEFAFAIADFASQNYASGAMHLGAGVAFAAVAVAAGAGSAALSAPAAAVPEEGRSAKDNQNNNGGDVIINYNSPVIALTDRAQMGRELRGLMSDADARFGT